MLRVLGSGGQGIVYLSERRGTDSFTLPVALKVFSPERYESDRAYDEAMSRIAQVSAHTSPLAPLGGRETGGMNVYVRELSRSLGARGWQVDIFTRLREADAPRVQAGPGPGCRTIHIPAGPAGPMVRPGERPRCEGAASSWNSKSPRNMPIRCSSRPIISGWTQVSNSTLAPSKPICGE